MQGYTIKTQSPFGTCSYENETVVFRANASAEGAKWSLQIDFQKGKEDRYIFSPACAYDGNRFERAKKGYPPMYENGQTGANAQPLTSYLPALNIDGSGEIQVTSGDMATPCVGVFFKESKEAFFLFTEQCVKGKNLGFKIEYDRITVQYPSDRKKVYTMCEFSPCHTDLGVAVESGEEIVSKTIIYTFACENLTEFFEFFFRNRKSLLRGEHAKTQYASALWNTMENHFNAHNWSGEYYAEANHIWQCGWCGGGQSSYALLKLGNEETKARAIKTIDFMTSHIAPTGFFYGVVENGQIKDDSFYNYGFAWIQPKAGYEEMKDALLVRKSGDALYFLYKHFECIQPKQAWVDGAKKCADAFVNLFNRYGTFGQFVNIQTGEMLINTSSAGASAVGALVKSWEYFGDTRYLETAKKAGEYYYQNFVLKGVTSGGPGEILCAPDSESAYALVESFVVLYEATKEKKWLQYARHATHLFSSWVFSYTYEWVVECEFKRLGVNTVGSVFANVQNKHSAPGICTFSGDKLYRLYEYTGDKLYLELIQDIAYFLPQCVSTEERPIYSWEYPYGDERGRLPAGYICERVNTSDWETEKLIGGVWKGSCWCETSVVLSYAELLNCKDL